MYLVRLTVMVAAYACCGVALANVFHDYEDLDEGFLGETVVHQGVAFRDANLVSGKTPDGQPFGPTDLGNLYIIENAEYFYNDFPGYGSPLNSLTFGRSFVPGPNLTIGPLASIWLDLDEVGQDVSLDLAYYENGPWGGIEYTLEAWRNGHVAATDSFLISDLGGRDNPTFTTMSIRGSEFDQLHLYGWLRGEYTAPRGMIDNLSITAIPEPNGLLAILLGVGAAGRRR